MTPSFITKRTVIKSFLAILRPLDNFPDQLVGVVAQLAERLVRNEIRLPGLTRPPFGLSWTSASIRAAFRYLEVDPLGLIIPPIFFEVV